MEKIIILLQFLKYGKFGPVTWLFYFDQFLLFVSNYSSSLGNFLHWESSWIRIRKKWMRIHSPAIFFQILAGVWSAGSYGRAIQPPGAGDSDGWAEQASLRQPAAAGPVPATGYRVLCGHPPAHRQPGTARQQRSPLLSSLLIDLEKNFRVLGQLWIAAATAAVKPKKGKGGVLGY